MSGPDQLRHRFDPATQYCTRCGQAREAVVDFGLSCYSGVVAISHLRAAQRQRELAEVVYGRRFRDR